MRLFIYVVANVPSNISRHVIVTHLDISKIWRVNPCDWIDWHFGDGSTRSSQHANKLFLSLYPLPFLTLSCIIHSGAGRSRFARSHYRDVEDIRPISHLPVSTWKRKWRNDFKHVFLVSRWKNLLLLLLFWFLHVYKCLFIFFN